VLDALLPILVLVAAVAFTVYCLIDLARASSVKHLPKWAWAVICLISEPLGGILYLIFGRDRRV
jgi:Phospholipase_D-nuclease N-terminal